MFVVGQTLPRSGVCAVATQGSSQYDTDCVTKYEIQTSLDRENWETYKENGTNKVNKTDEENTCRRFFFYQPVVILYMYVQFRSAETFHKCT